MITALLIACSENFTWPDYAVAYGVGYFTWAGYPINRFAVEPGNDDAWWQYSLALLWPRCVAVYLPYRIFKWMGVKP
jgi:hypothetical protein